MKTELKNLKHSSHTAALSKGTIFAEIADIIKIKRFLVLTHIFFKTTYMCVYLRTKFQVSSIILTSFKRGVILTPTSPHCQTNPSKARRN